jgi:ATP-dependent DNA helicase RecG
VFYLAGHIEMWGRGIEKIMSACRYNGIYPPQYDVSSTASLSNLPRLKNV